MTTGARRRRFIFTVAAALLMAIPAVGAPIFHITSPTDGSTIDFGDVIVGQTETRTVTLSQDSGKDDNMAIDEGAGDTRGVFSYSTAWSAGLVGGSPAAIVISDCVNIPAACAGGTELCPVVPPAGCTVDLTFTPTREGSETVDFTGTLQLNAPPSSSPVTVTLTGNGYYPARVLRVTVVGDGTVSGRGISCPGTCVHSYAHGKQVTLRAHPAAGAVFTGWSGGHCSGTGSCPLTMDRNRQATATFETATGGGDFLSQPPDGGSVPSGTVTFGWNSHGGSSRTKALADAAGTSYEVTICRDADLTDCTTYAPPSSARTAGRLPWTLAGMALVGGIALTSRRGRRQMALLLLAAGLAGGAVTACGSSGNGSNNDSGTGGDTSGGTTAADGSVWSTDGLSMEVALAAGQYWWYVTGTDANANTFVSETRTVTVE